MSVACLAVLVAAAPRPPAKPVFAHGDPNRVIRTVLAQPVYRTSETTNVAAKETPFEMAVHWIRDRLGAVLAAFFKAMRGAQNAGAAFGIGLVVALLSLLVFMLVRIISFFAFGRRRVKAEAFDPQATVLRPASEWLRLAQRAAHQGDFAAAIALLFNAALRRLDERGVVAFDAARSPAEYRALVRRTKAPASPAFDALARRFLLATFSGRSSGVTDFEETLAAYGTLEAATA